MLKIAIILALVCLLFRWAFGQWPWQAINAKPSRSDELAKARKLLGVRKVASRQDILAAHRQLVAKVHPDRGGSATSVHEANDARDLLLDELPDRGVKPQPDDASQD